MDMKVKLSTLWIFVALNYLYCGVASLVDPELAPAVPERQRRRP